LLGSALLYVNSGTTNLDGIYIINSLSEISLNIDDYISLKKDIINITAFNNLFNDEEVRYIHTLNSYDFYYINISLIVLIVGFLFKISAAPFHF